MSAVAVLDYGMCNLLNVVRAFEHCGARVDVVSDASRVQHADKVVVPGVGAFPDCMRELRARGFDDAIGLFAATGRPLLGICVGLQALFDDSEEFGTTPGLGLIGGSVKAIPSTDSSGAPHRVPHIGWTHLALPAHRSTWSGTLLDDLGDAPAFYFVHSFTAHPADSRHRLADAWYGGRQISAAVQKDNVVGVQFHPEKSGPTGLGLIKRFLSL